MVFVVSGLYRFDSGVSKVEGFVFSLYQGFLPGDDLAVLIPAFDEVDSGVVLMPVGDQDQISRKVVSLAGIRINIDDFSLTRDDPQASVTLVQKRTGGAFFSHC